MRKAVGAFCWAPLLARLCVCALRARCDDVRGGSGDREAETLGRLLLRPAAVPLDADAARDCDDDAHRWAKSQAQRAPGVYTSLSTQWAFWI